MTGMEVKTPISILSKDQYVVSTEKCRWGACRFTWSSLAGKVSHHQSYVSIDISVDPLNVC